MPALLHKHIGGYIIGAIDLFKTKGLAVMKQCARLTLALAMLGILLLALGACGKRAPRVETHTIGRKDLVEKVRASGRIGPKYSVDVSATVMGRILALFVQEGDAVAEGDTLLLIDPARARGGYRQAEASVRAAEARLELARSKLAKTEDERGRQEELFDKGLSPRSTLIAARTAHEVQSRAVLQAKGELQVAIAGLDISRHDLEQVTIVADISGIVVRLNVEEGENVVLGTMNVPGTVLMTIADLSVMEAEVLVDETDVVNIRVGQEAEVTVDAFPDTTLVARVTEVGNSAANPARLGSQQSTDYKVVLLIDGPIEGLRPGLSATAEIRIDSRDDVLAVPIKAMTLRNPAKEAKRSSRDKRAESDDTEGSEIDSTGSDNNRDVDGVFIVEGRRVRFQAVDTGITGEKDFEVVSGLNEGDVIVTGPFEIIRRMHSGEKIRIRKGRRSSED